MAEFGNNYDYGDSPYYKDDDTSPDGVDVMIFVRQPVINGVIVST